VRIEQTILKNLFKNEEYTKKVLPFLKPEYFSNNEDRLVFNEISKFVLKYNQQPTIDALEIEINNIRGTTDASVEKMREMIKVLNNDQEKTNEEYLLEKTEEFCQQKAIFNAMTQSLEIMNGNSKLSKGAIPQLLSDALAISFDPNVGHNFFSDYKERYEYYHRVEEKIRFDLEVLNKATKGGVAKKTLNMIMGGVHAGKTRTLCHLSAAYLTMGKNVLYITLEMSEEEISKRIDANVLNVTLDELIYLSEDSYEKKIKSLRNITNGELVVKEYPGTSANVNHFKALLNELKLKQNFIPDVIMIDYLNLCASSRLNSNGAGDLYGYVKSIAEEVRGFAQQVELPIWSATQLNRNGFKSSDPDITDTAESFGLPATVDLLWVLIANEQLKQLNQIVFKQLKNRYDDMDRMPRFVVGVDNPKMRLYDVEQSANTLVGQTNENKNIELPIPRFEKKDKFKGLKV